MTLNTSRFALTYPQDSDSPDGPSQIQDLAQDVETRLGYAGARGGKSIVSPEQQTTSASYVFLGTPDRVQGIDLPTDGLIVVAFQGLFKSSVASTGRAAIFLGATQLKARHGRAGAGSSVDVVEAPTTGIVYSPLVSAGGAGLATIGSGADTTDADVTTGQAVGGIVENTQTLYVASGSTGFGPSPGISAGLCYIFAAAGTYDVGVKFKISSGTLSAKGRKLWVWTKEFPTSGV